MVDMVQVLNPRSNRYIKIDRDKGIILSSKKSEGPYKNIPIINQSKNSPPDRPGPLGRRGRA